MADIIRTGQADGEIIRHTVLAKLLIFYQCFCKIDGQLIHDGAGHQQGVIILAVFVTERMRENFSITKIGRVLIGTVVLIAFFVKRDGVS